MMDAAADKDRFSAGVGALAITFGREATQTLISAYWMGLCDLDVVSFERAVREAIRSYAKMPLPAELRELANGGSPKDLALVAWGVVQRAMPMGAYRHVDFEDRTINAVIRGLGGWPMLFERCAGADGEKWYRIEFLKDYEALSRRGVSEDAGRPLAGLAQVEVIDGKRVEPVPRLVSREAPAAPRIERRQVERSRGAIVNSVNIPRVEFRSVAK